MRAVIAAMLGLTLALPAGAKEEQVAKEDPLVSAEVVLKPASGAALENAAITAANVRDFAPAPDAVEAARRFFQDAGFQASGLAGISFTISAPRSVFESVFGTKLSVTAKKAEPMELPSGRLPAALRKVVKAVTFSRPPEFGPTGQFR